MGWPMESLRTEPDASNCVGVVLRGCWCCEREDTDEDDGDDRCIDQCRYRRGFSRTDYSPSLTYRFRKEFPKRQGEGRKQD